MKRIMRVVDDSSIARKTLQKFLCSDYDILEAENDLAAPNVLAHKSEIVTAIVLNTEETKRFAVWCKKATR